MFVEIMRAILQNYSITDLFYVARYAVKYVKDASVIDMTPVSTQIPPTTQTCNDMYLESAKLCSIIPNFKSGSLLHIPEIPLRITMY